ncbi:MAG: TIM44-like domain-containing protein [Clostridia bacterium]|nr:TIM44-like domain-containing protein [Clostridia bacterium]
MNLCQEKITESEFKAKIDSMFIMLYISIMIDNLKRVSNFLSDSLMNRYEKFLSELNKNNERQMYDLLNVESTKIENTEIVDNKFVVKVKLLTKYMDYVEDKMTKKILRGNNKEQIKKTILLTLEKDCDENNTDWIFTDVETV